MSAISRQTRLHHRQIGIAVRQEMKGDRLEQAQAAHALRLRLRGQLQRDHASIRMSDQVKLFAGPQLPGEHRLHQANFVARL